MAQYEEQNELDYRPGGDTIDDFAQKYMKEINRVYQFLNNIREHNSNGTYQVEPQPYIFKVTDNKLYIRNGANNAWLYLFDITYRMGMSDNPDAVILTSDDVTSTAEALKLVKTNSDGDIDANITGNATYFGSRLAADYITVDDVSDSGAALKIVKTDSNGVAQISISGSAVQLNGKAATYYLNQDDVTTTGEANKIVKTDVNGKIAADITGNAAKFGNKTADNYLTTDDVATVEPGTVTSTPNKLVKTNANGLLPVNISGNAGQIAGKNAEINNLQDGQVLTYRLASNTWRNEDKGVVGSGKALAIYDGATLLGEYSGDAPMSIDLQLHDRLKNTAYALGDCANHPTLPANWFLEITTAGTTANADLTIATPAVGDTITDGTATWTIRQKTSNKDINDVKGLINTYAANNYRKPSTAYGIGDVRYHETLPCGWYLVCSTAGTTANADLTITDPTVGGTVTDGTVTWTIGNWSPNIIIQSVGLSHNGIYRGKNLGTFTSVAAFEAFLTAHEVSSGKFTDLYLGDYFTIQDGTYNKEWEIAGFDHYLHKGDTDFATHHLVLIPKTNLFTADMNDSNTTANGYAGSKMHTTHIPTINTKLATVLGNHLLTRRELLTTSMSTSLASMAGAGQTGASNDWASWSDVKSVLPNEVEIYGCTALSSSFFDVGIGCEKLPIFNFKGHSHERESFWLRAVASSTAFCHASYNGHAGSYDAGSANGVRPLICVG